MYGMGIFVFTMHPWDNNTAIFIKSLVEVIIIIISKLLNTVEPLIKDTLNKEHPSIKDKSTRPNSYYTSTF